MLPMGGSIGLPPLGIEAGTTHTAARVAVTASAAKCVDTKGKADAPVRPR